MKIFGEELRKSIEAEKQRYIDTMNRRDERIANGEEDEDDCFMSIRVESQAIDRCNMELEILKGDGLMNYDAIIDENGEEVSVHCFENKWRRTT